MNTIKRRVFNLEAIRDTTQHTSNLAGVEGYAVKTLVIENGLNKQVTIELWASINDDFSNSFQVGSSFDVSATTNSYQTLESHFPKLKVKAQCTAPPTSGSLTVIIYGVS